MKPKKLFQSISLLILLVSLATSQTNVLAAAATQQDTGPIASIHVDDSNMRMATVQAIKPGDTITYAIDLQNLPAEGLTSAEFACRYDPDLVEISALTDAGLFGSDAIAAINGPAGGTFIYAIAGVTKKATVAGTVFKFNLKALKVGSFSFECRVRASKGGTLFEIPFTPATITISDVPVNGTLTGKVIASKPVTVMLTSGATTLSVAASADGSFSLNAPAGTYTASASASGFLKAEGSATLTAGTTTSLPTITLLAGDINNDAKIDANDVLTIGINYNKSTPPAADLNNDGFINVLDLQFLAPNYGKTGPILWK